MMALRHLLRLVFYKIAQLPCGKYAILFHTKHNTISGFRTKIHQGFATKHRRFSPDSLRIHNGFGAQDMDSTKNVLILA